MVYSDSEHTHHDAILLSARGFCAPITLSPLESCHITATLLINFLTAGPLTRAIHSLEVQPPRLRHAPEKTMTGTCHAGSSLIFLRMKKRRCSPSLCMKGVPGVMQLESNPSGPAGSSPLLTFSFSICIKPDTSVASPQTQHCVALSQVHLWLHY